MKYVYFTIYVIHSDPSLRKYVIDFKNIRGQGSSPLSAHDSPLQSSAHLTVHSAPTKAFKSVTFCVFRRRRLSLHSIYSNGMDKTGANGKPHKSTTNIPDFGHTKHKLARDGIIKMLNGSVLLFPFFCMIIDVSFVRPVPTCLYVPN